MSERSSKDPMTSKVEAAARQAATKVVRRARQTGTPIVLWEDNQVKEITADEIELRMSIAEFEKSES